MDYFHLSFFSLLRLTQDWEINTNPTWIFRAGNIISKAELIFINKQNCFFGYRQSFVCKTDISVAKDQPGSGWKTCMGAHFPAVELKLTRTGLALCWSPSGGVRVLWHGSKWTHHSVVNQRNVKAWSDQACSLQADVNDIRKNFKSCSPTNQLDIIVSKVWYPRNYFFLIPWCLCCLWWRI